MSFKKEYQDLVIEHHVLSLEVQRIQAAYIQVFHQELLERLELKNMVIAYRAAIQFAQSEKMKGRVFFEEEIEKVFETAKQSVFERTAKVIEELKEVKEPEKADEDVAQKSKLLFRQLLKMIHPDLNPGIEKEAYFDDVWKRLIEAYAQFDLPELNKVKEIIEAYRKVETQVENEEDNEQLYEIKKNAILDQIVKIKSEKPYTFINFIKDDEAITKQRLEFSDEISKLKIQIDNLRTIFEEIRETGLKH